MFYTNRIYKNKLTLLALISLLSLIAATLQILYGNSGGSEHAFGSDDAYISYRYAQNLFLGNGLVYNLNNNVEGYSNFLYTVLLSTSFFAKSISIYWFSNALNLLFFLGSIIVIFSILEKHTSPRSSLLGAAIFGLNPISWAHAATGLESMMMLFLTLVLWKLLLSGRTTKNAIFIYFVTLLCILTRVDGFIIPILICVYLWVSDQKSFSLKLFAYIALVMVSYTIIRLIYYHDYIANTYHAKVSGELLKRIYSGVEFLFNNTVLNGILLMAAVVLMLMFKEHFRLDKKYKLPLFLGFAWSSYLIFIGGDIYQERFILFLFTLILVLFVSLTDTYKLSYKIFFLRVTPLILGFSILLHDSRFDYQTNKYDMWITLGKALSNNSKNTTLAIDGAGKVPYFSKLPTLDMLGLNDRYLGKLDISNKPYFTPGHNKYDPEYVISKKPTIIASWVKENLDCLWGLKKSIYTKNYKIAYLVNSRMKHREPNIINVQGLDENTISAYIRDQYNYALLIEK